MKNILIKQSIITTLFLVFLCILLFGFCNTYAEEQSPYLDLEDDPKAVISYGSIKNKSGLILNSSVVENNRHVLALYLNDGGQIIIPNRASGDNILGWRVLEITDSDYTLDPFYIYNSSIDKNAIDYTEEFSSSQNTAFATDFMSGSISFSVYGSDWFNRIGLIAHVNVSGSFDYFDINNDNYSYYIGKYEVSVTPYDERAKVTSFKMSLMMSSDENRDLDSSIIATNDVKGTETFGISIGSEYGYSVNAIPPSIGESGKIGATFSYSYSAPDGSSTISGPIPNNFGDDAYTYRTFTVKPTDASDYDESYSGLIHVAYRMPSYQQFGGAGITFHGLSLKSKINNPGYDEENADCAVIMAAWSYPFEEKTMVIGAGQLASLIEDDVEKQYFNDYSLFCSLPNKSILGSTYVYTEN